MKKQRKICMQRGTWMPSPKERTKSEKGLLRFYRLSEDAQYLYFSDFTETSMRDPLDDDLKEHGNSLYF